MRELQEKKKEKKIQILRKQQEGYKTITPILILFINQPQTV